MEFDPDGKILAAIRLNRRRLDMCKKHLFDIGAPPYTIGQVVTCSNCQGQVKLTAAAMYARGYAAAGGNPNEVIPGFFDEEDSK